MNSRAISPPVFSVSYTKDTFAGVSDYWGAKQFNAFCTVHFNDEAYDKGELKEYLGIYCLEEASAFHPHAALPPKDTEAEKDDDEGYED